MNNEYFDRKYFNKQPLKKTIQLFQIQIFEEFSAQHTATLLF